MRQMIHLHKKNSLKSIDIYECFAQQSQISSRKYLCPNLLYFENSLYRKTEANRREVRGEELEVITDKVKRRINR